MKHLVTIVILLLSTSVFAENMGEMSEEKMQQMMQQAQGLATCMQNIDQAEMQAFEQRAKQIEAETQALCASGNRDEAMQKAMAFSKEVSNNKGIQEMKKCGEGMKNMMPSMAMVDQHEGKEKSVNHICDKP
jgi:hypothetical protein